MVYQCSRSWVDFARALSPRLQERGPVDLGRLLRWAYDAARLEHSLWLPPAPDPLTFVIVLARVGFVGGAWSLQAAYALVAQRTCLSQNAPEDFTGLFSPTIEQAYVDREPLVALFDAALSSFEGGETRMNPFGEEGSQSLLNALDGACEAGANLTWLSCALFLAFPDAYLPLDGPVFDFMISPFGLSIDEETMPRTAQEYLELVGSLRQQMEEGRLPYRSFAQMARSAALGHTLAQGLVARDRAELVLKYIRPELKRLWPCDQKRVDDELSRLLAD